ncbi:hypothetical protein LEP1GSC081_2899 [Leptospira kirschneri str. H1]|uniref:Uncharacterized protein n=1 Tax=Leptospira kirschneri str. H1 TaxID=1049966 RepID=A0A0E2B5D4_9LEPT|nr:hypothetical protein LEP1GSC081_2899 [Leptospira kirschneri str. H1]
MGRNLVGTTIKYKKIIVHLIFTQNRCFAVIIKFKTHFIEV